MPKTIFGDCQTGSRSSYMINVSAKRIPKKQHDNRPRSTKQAITTGATLTEKSREKRFQLHKLFQERSDTRPTNRRLPASRWRVRLPSKIQRAPVRHTDATSGMGVMQGFRPNCAKAGATGDFRVPIAEKSATSRVVFRTPDFLVRSPRFSPSRPVLSFDSRQTASGGCPGDPGGAFPVGLPLRPLRSAFQCRLARLLIFRTSWYNDFRIPSSRFFP
jgi:hypothetical protein